MTDMKKSPYVIILAGGLGIKLWPQSRSFKPKQFLDLLGTGRTLLQMTFDRFISKYPLESFLVLTSKEYVSIVKEQLPELKEEQIIIEPIRRNTGAALALASYMLRKIDKEADVIVSPSDLVIFNEDAFFKAVSDALLAAQEGDKLLAIGIRPHSPDTNFRYIQYIEEKDVTAKKIKTFTENPDLALAQTFVDSGDFLWNSGTLVWKNRSIIQAFESYLPELSEVFEEGSAFYGTKDEEAFLRKAYSLIKNVSIDYGILEKSDNVYAIQGEFSCAILNAWQNLYDLKNKDDHQNVLESNALLYDTESCLIRSDSEKLIVVQGLKDYLVADSDKVLLICKLGEEGKYREFLKDAKDRGVDYM